MLSDFELIFDVMAATILKNWGALIKDMDLNLKSVPHWTKKIIKKYLPMIKKVRNIECAKKQKFEQGKNNLRINS